MSPPIFISYSSKDQTIAETIYQALEARGQKCWIACRDVHPGENYQEAIVRALRGAKVMLLVFTSNANNSDEIKKELVLAGRNRIAIVPVRVEDVMPNDAFSYELATRQWIDLFKDWERQIELVVARVSQLVTGTAPENAGALPPVPSLPARPSRPPLLLLGSIAAAALVALGGGAFYMRTRAPVTATAPSLPAAAPAAPSAATPAAPPPPVIQAAPVAPTPAPVAAPPASPAAAALAPIAPAPIAPAPSAPALSPDDTAWQSALGAGTREAINAYLGSFASGAHVQEAQLRLASLIMAAPGSNKFDGAWDTTWTCTDYLKFPGFAYQFTAQVKDGNFHGRKGAPGEAGSLELDGKVDADGAAAFLGKGVVGAVFVALGGAPRGAQYAFHALGQFNHNSGTAKRLEGRPCSISFTK